MSRAEQIDAAPSGPAYGALLTLDQAAWDAIPLGMALFNPDGHIARRNARAALVWTGGNEPVWHDHSRRTDAGETVAAVEQALRFGTGVRGLRETIETSDGAQTEISSDVEVFHTASGRILGVLHCFRETGPAPPRHEHEHLASIVEYSDDAIISKNLNGIILSWNKGAEHLFGYTADEAVGKSITMLIPQHRIDDEPEILRRIRGGERIDHYETVRRHKDGTLVDISLTVSPVRDGRGAIIAASKIARNISDRKRAEAQRYLLMAELNHRVKNTLATVISIARQSFPGADVADARAAFDARIRGLAQTHSRLADANWESVPLETLFADEFAPYRQNGIRNVNFNGPPVELSPRCALTLCLAVHELVTNAAKYGALSTDFGAVDVNWNLDSRDQGLDIDWSETGGPSVSPPQRLGFGRLLLERALVSDLRSEVRLDFDPQGFRCHIRIPAPQYRVRT
ncbi:MAG TPA: PAS domain S-box protein [Rhizomicrobium sp.]|jgi:PAS domain S-box-containing protein|nr:PAS domain S-box protein [Rhizomicrobium sp.]